MTERQNAALLPLEAVVRRDEAPSNPTRPRGQRGPGEDDIRVEVDELTGVYKNLPCGIVAVVFRCKPSGGTERTSSESTAVSWLTPDEVSERMSEAFAVRLLDAWDGNGPNVRNHDGKRLISSG
ncbi:NUDIX hydrolase [Streptomyces sp. NPDC003656]